MTDARIRDLERRAAQGEPGARRALTVAECRTFTGHALGYPTFICSGERWPRVVGALWALCSCTEYGRSVPS